MPQASTSLSAALVKAYKNALFKLNATHLEESSAVDALGQKPFTAVLTTLEETRLRSDISLNRAFSNLATALLELDVRALWTASKQGARERLRALSGARGEGLNDDQKSSVIAGDEQQASHGKDLKSIMGQDGYLRSSLLFVLAQASRSFMQQLNTTEVHGAEVMEQALDRPQGQALITVCNHVAAMDDPLVLATVVPPEYYRQPENIRWTLCASDRCFKYASLSPLFTAAKVLPIQRGGGMKQPGMQAAEERLKQGDWVHIFPEGTRSQGGGKMGQVRKGVGKLVAACGQAPLVVPFVHSGMEQVMPRGKTLPSVGKTVRVLVGQPIPVEDLLTKAKQLQWSEDQLHSAVARRVSTHLHALKSHLDSGHPQAAMGPVSDVMSDLEAVSSLDLYDESDLRWHHRASMWEKVKFRMQARRWLLEGAMPAKYDGGFSQSRFSGPSGAGGNPMTLNPVASAQPSSLHGSSSLPAFTHSWLGAQLQAKPWDQATFTLYAKSRIEKMVDLLQCTNQPPATGISFA